MTTRAQKAGAGIGVLAIAGALAFPHLQRWEGLSTKPYVDVVGVKTVCYGETRVAMRPYTVAECRQMAIEALQRDFGPVILRCTPGIAGQRPEVLASALLLTYNIGGAAYCRSTVARRFNAGQWRQGCDAYLDWNKGTFRREEPGLKCEKRKNGNYVCAINGLTNRRQDERKLCLSGVTP